jgi:ubiquitin-protein ligase E3 C
MFTGEAFGRRVDLRGSHANMDRATLLEKQRRDREERERLRIRTNACTTIQSVWRGYTARRMCRVTWKHDILLAHACDPDRILQLLWGLDSVSGIPPPLPSSLIDSLLSHIPSLSNGRKIIYTRALIRLFPVAESKNFHAALEWGTTIPAILNRRMDIGSLFSRIQPDLGSRILIQVAEFGEQKLTQKCVLWWYNYKATPSGIHHQLTEEIPDGLDIVRVCSNMARVLVSRRDETLLDWLKLMSSRDPNCQSACQSVLLSSVPSLEIGMFELIDFTSLSEDVIFRIATGSSACQDLADELVRRLSGSLTTTTHLVNAFTALYSTVVRGIYAGSSSIVDTRTIEQLFPLLNWYGYRLIVNPATTTLPTNHLYTLIRSVYDKKFLFKALQNESVWVIPESVNHIPPNFNSFEMIDRLRRESEEEMEDHVETASPHVGGGSFERLIEVMPHVIPFQDRVRILASALAEDKRNHFLASRSSLGFPQRSRAYLKRVRRDMLLEDGLTVFDPPGGTDTLKDVLQIEFVSIDGRVEAGIDGGGLFKEFIHEWARAVMNPEFGLFRQLDNGRLSPSSTAYVVHAPHVADRLFASLGRAVGKALYDMVLLDTHLGESFLNRMIGRSFSIEQLAEIDESLYRSLKFVGTDCQNVDDLSLTFSVSVGSEIGNVAREIELIPGGSHMPVTNENKIRYVLLSSWFHLAKELDKPAQAFASGFNEVVPMSWLRMFSPREINLLISGEQRRGFDVNDLKQNVVYGGGYTEKSETIVLFWELMHELSDEDKSAFLQFVTSSPRPPLLGFRVLHPKFAINRVPEADRLPTASTCNNLFKLPDYRNKEVLKEKLIAALYSHGGFDLS